MISYLQGGATKKEKGADLPPVPAPGKWPKTLPDIF